MSEKEKPFKSKLFKLKQWLTVPETARHLSTLFGEDVTEADVLRLALDGHLMLSVNFVNQVYGKRGKLVSYEEVENLPPEFRSILTSLPEDSRNSFIEAFMKLGHFPGKFLYLDDKLTTTEGVWDLPMVAGQRYNIEGVYQRLIGGPNVEARIMGAAYFMREGWEVFQLYEELDTSSFYAKNENPLDLKEESDPYLHIPAVAHLPDDSVLVVRTSALLELQESLSAEDYANAKPLGPTERRSVLKMILAMAVGGYAYKPDDSKSQTPQEIVDDAAKNDHSINVDTVRKWLKAAAKLPKDPA